MTPLAALFLALMALLAGLMAAWGWAHARANRAYREIFSALIETRGSGPGLSEDLYNWLSLSQVPLKRRVAFIRANIGFQAACSPESLDFSGEILDVMTALQSPRKGR